MKTLPVTPENSGAVAETAARLLASGGVAVIPTDTVYGIAAHPDHAAALERVIALKGRPTDKPVALLAADLAAVRAFGAALPPAAERLAAAFWPGALTLVLPCHGREEGFRVPAHVWTRSLLAACGGVLRVTSANASGEAPAASAGETLGDVGRDADLVIDDGPAPGGVASTVVRVAADNAVTILRAGAIPESDILAAASESGPRTPESGPRTPESGPRTPESGIRNPESGIRNPESGPRTPESGRRTTVAPP
jgi:L-threonylcarbamoyladenylate synthase